MTNIVHEHCNIIDKLNKEKNNGLEKTHQKNEKESRFLLDVKILSSLKSIPGKTIPLKTDLQKNAKDENINQNKNPINTIVEDKQNSIINRPITKSAFSVNIDKNNKNNSFLNNNITTNNFYFNGGINNTNINITLNNIFNNNNNNQTNSNFCLFQDPYALGHDTQLYFSQSNHPSILSYQSKKSFSKMFYNNNNNFMWTSNRISQDSFLYPNYLLNNNNSFINRINNGSLNVNNINNINNISQQSYQLKFQQPQLSQLNHEFLNKKRTCEIKPEEHIIPEIKKPESINKSNKKQLMFKTSSNEEDNLYEKEDTDYIYRKINVDSNNNEGNKFNFIFRKYRKKKRNNLTKGFHCSHPKCEFSYNTLKQLQNHHYKMIPECQNDSIQIMKLIYSTKVILLNLFNKNPDSNEKKNYLSKLYKKSLDSISLSNYSEVFTGTDFEDKRKLF